MLSLNLSPVEGDLILTYREDAQRHVRGVALLGLADMERAFHGEKLVALHPDNRVLSAGRFFLDKENRWACPSLDEPKTGVPLNHVIRFKKTQSDPELLFLSARDAEQEDAWINALLTPAQMQFCLRLYLDGGSDAIKLVRGFEVEDEILALLHLEKKQRAGEVGRPMMDLIGLYDRHGTEIELLQCSREGHVQFHVGFEKGGKGTDQVRAYSEGTPLDFFEDCPRIKLRELFDEK